MNRQGFTLVEIVIVLGVASLIVILVFIAVQGAQRGQRNQARKDLANRVVAHMSEYRGNHNNQTPDAASIQDYFTTSQLTLPAIGLMSITDTAQTCPSSGTPPSIIWIIPGFPDKARVCLEQDSIHYEANAN